MALTLEQYNALQPRVVEVQRLALLFAELGESKVSGLLMQAAVRASRLKPTKDAAAVEQTPKKGKGA